MSEWRDIATAPKDGTYILVARAGEDIGSGPMEITNWFDTGPTYNYEPDPENPGLFRQVLFHDGFHGWNNNGHRATHWMPLPEGPPIEPERTGEAA